MVKDLLVERAQSVKAGVSCNVVDIISTRISPVLEWKRRSYSDIEGRQVAGSGISSLVRPPPAIVHGAVCVASDVDDALGINVEARAFVVVISFSFWLVNYSQP